nr:MAG TPA: hypothetical protein [Caudoviricetes sp.]
MIGKVGVANPDIRHFPNFPVFSKYLLIICLS